MGFGKVVRAAKASTPLVSLIKEHFKSEELHPPLTVDSFLRCSSLSSMCPREEVLCVIHDVPRTMVVNTDLSLVFSLGNALHNNLQNAVLPALGDTLYGQWRCTSCGLLTGGPKDGKSLLESIIPRPKSCACGAAGFIYEEVSLRSDQYHLTGHPDGFLKIPEYAGFGILEAKSISERGAWEVKKTPKMDHVIQAQMYMWFTGTQWAQILYWDKGTFGINGLIEHHVERDDDVLEGILESINGLWSSIESYKSKGEKVLPERICAVIDCPKAKTCAVATQCFSEST